MRTESDSVEGSVATRVAGLIQLQPAAVSKMQTQTYVFATDEVIVVTDLIVSPKRQNVCHRGATSELVSYSYQ